MGEQITPELVALTSRLSPTQAFVMLLLLPCVLLIYVGSRFLLPGAGGDGAIERTKTLLDGMQAELRRTRELLDHYGAEIRRYDGELQQLREARATLAARAQELFDAAVAARLMVHELERRLHLVETSFAPLRDGSEGVHDALK